MPDNIPSRTKTFTRDTSKDIYEEVSYDTTKPKFDVVTINADVEYTSGWGNTQFFVYYHHDTNSLTIREVIYTESGASSTLTTQWRSWYDTTNNKIKWTDNTASSWHLEGFSFPLAKIICGESAITSIDQVFNGFGYIGSTVFALPGVKGLIPSGRNVDGSLKNIEFTLDSVKTATRTWIDGDSRQVWGFCLNPPVGIAETWYWNNYVESDEVPSKNEYIMWYKPSENITYVNNTAQSSTPNWVKVNYINFGEANGINSQEVKRFTSKTAFNALDYNDKSVISGWGMPSNRYIDLTLGASGATYTAPANGYVVLSARWTNENSYFDIDNLQYIICHNQTGYNGYTEGSGYIPVKRGQIFTVYYQNIELKWFGFIYAEGEN